uniref:Predicted protein n=1 Tax=Physcomitrium patens TaxID=3218 RepID=A9U5Y7_PHYPA
MGEASKEANLRDPMSIGHQFTEETFEELKIGSCRTGDSSSLIVKSVKRFVKNRIFTKEFGSLFQGALLPNKFKQLELPAEVLSSPVEEIIKDIERITESETITLPILPPIVLLPMASGGVSSVPTGPPVPPIGPIGPAVPISVPMGQVGDQTTIALSLVRAKVWEECHYDRILNSNPILIPTQGSSKFPNWNNLANSITGAMAPATHSTVPIQGVLNPVPLQAVPSPMASTYPEFAPYQPPGVNTQELPMLPGSKETNEMLLLNLTKKMEELAVNMAKEKEKRPKQTNFRTNVWCTNCKGQGHMVQDCPSPGNMKIQCMNCGGKHPTNNCWYLSNPHFNNTMSPSMSWDVNQIQGSNGNGWNGSNSKFPRGYQSSSSRLSS